MSVDPRADAVSAGRNPYLCLTIVAILGGVVLLGVLGIIILTLYNKEPPASLVALASGAAGSLGSFLVSVPRGSAGVHYPPRGTVVRVPSPGP